MTEIVLHLNIRLERNEIIDCGRNYEEEIINLIINSLIGSIVSKKLTHKKLYDFLKWQEISVNKILKYYFLCFILIL